MTTTQDILRAAAAIVDTSWSAQDDALDADGKAVPLYIAGIGDTARAGLNPAAVRFSAYGAITKATEDAPRARLSMSMWDTLRTACLAAGARGDAALSFYNRMAPAM